MSRKPTIATRLRPSVHAVVLDLAEREGRSLSDMVSRLIVCALNEGYEHKYHIPLKAPRPE